MFCAKLRDTPHAAPGLVHLSEGALDLVELWLLRLHHNDVELPGGVMQTQLDEKGQLPNRTTPPPLHHSCLEQPPPLPLRLCFWITLAEAAVAKMEAKHCGGART